MAPRLSRISQSFQQSSYATACRAIAGSTPATPSFIKLLAPVCHASTVAQRRKHRDPYAIAQAKARKAANISRQTVLQQERKEALGDPVRGITTPLVESFDTAGTATPSEKLTRSSSSKLQSSNSSSVEKSQENSHLNFFLTGSELDDSLRRSDWLTSTPPSNPSVRLFGGESPEEQEARKLEQKNTAEEALRRISSLSLGTSKDRLRVNKQRCIDIFGRHNTDSHLGPRPGARPANLTSNEDGELDGPLRKRVGPDTGSSEVQIAILTAKIRSLADFLGDRGVKDKTNKRNLRLLVHRRAKLLKYLREKERGGPRWQNLVESLGLTEGTWKGEISL